MIPRKVKFFILDDGSPWDSAPAMFYYLDQKGEFERYLTEEETIAFLTSKGIELTK